MVKKVEKKICVLGDWASGKTSLVRRYVYNIYEDRYVATIGVKVSRKNMVIKNIRKNPLLKVNLTMLLWDLVGQKEFHAVQTTAYMGTNGAFIVCDLTRPETIDSMDWWITSLFEKTRPIPLVFLANKVDLTDDAIPLFYQ
ncbi:MAG: GTP-binding protein [Thermoplasmata archaeon]|nr:MAG: GTP-binding protein [Thermoplasmata archaeon]